MKGREKEKRTRKRKRRQKEKAKRTSVCNFPFFDLIAPGNSVGNSGTGLDRRSER
jgi:hypothetical protein